MKQEEVEKRISKDRADFNNAVYKGKLPKDFIEKFKKAIFVVSPMSDNISTASLKEWVSSDIKNLNFGQVSKMCDIIAGVRRDKVFSSIEESIDFLSSLEKVHMNCREMYEKNEEKLKRKRSALLNETGTMDKVKRLPVKK